MGENKLAYYESDIFYLKCLGFNTKEIAERMGVTIRWVQMVVQKELGRRGRTSNVPMYTEDDVLILMKYPNFKDSIGERRFKKYYEGMNPNAVLPHLKLRAEVLRRDNYKCKFCGDYRNLEAHHFRNKGSLNLDDCVTLCKPCHWDAHKGKRYLNASFHKKLFSKLNS